MENKKDSLGDRMKMAYENRTRYLLPRRTYSMIRIDGKAFHTYTKGLIRPFDMKLVNDMDETAIYLCKNIQGAKLAFVQSDEISILLTDFDSLTSDAWFDGNIQKIASVSASLATARFNQLRMEGFFANYSDKIVQGKIDIDIQLTDDLRTFKLATFDSRVFTLPTATEVSNYLVWRQNDTVRNSISSVAQSLFSHKELMNVNTNQMQEMCFQKGVNWNDFDLKLKNGRVIMKVEEEFETPFKGAEFKQSSFTRSKWKSVGAPTFTADHSFLDALIPKND